MILKGSREELVEKAAWILADVMQELLEEQDHVVLAVPGGRSVAKVFERLRDEPLPWDRVHVFMVDERLVPLGDDESNFRLVEEHLASDGLPERNLHPFKHVPDAHDAGIRAYERELESLGGSFDVVLLSAGEDGHVGGLYPNHHSVSEQGVFVTMDDSPKPPARRMTASRGLLEKAGAAVVLFFGESKGVALEKFLEEGPVESCPARLVKSLESWYALTDQDFSG
ncbi:6-phosphogluconolactonase [Candidatus Woesearchaeota archaeon]|nr:6-phosphogluconolactonase [Candidatus Woesearchaeota archaeon]